MMYADSTMEMNKMKKVDVKIGMKVVPFRKTVWGNFSGSTVWNTAKNIQQPFLYVVGWDNEEQAYILNDSKKTKTGDFFKASDFNPYIPEKKVKK